MVRAIPLRVPILLVTDYSGMPRIPGCTEALATLMLDKGTNDAAQSAFEAALPKPWRLTSDRLHNKENDILSALGQGKQAGAKENVDETVMLAKAVRVKAHL